MADRPHPAVIFREAEPRDAEVIVDVIESAYRGPGSRAGWTTEADLLDGQRTDSDEIHAALRRPGVTVIVAVEETGAVLGCCQIERRHRAIAYFGSFAVRPGLQRQGLGRRLLAEAERRARAEWDVEAMEMTVIAQRQDLISWYERRGYALTGETRPFPYGDERAGSPRRPDLHFVVLQKSLSEPAKAGPELPEAQ